MLTRGKHCLLGVEIAAVDYDYAVHTVVDAARRGAPLSVTALAVHGLMTGVLDRVHRRRLNGFDLVVPDGQPLRWALRWVHKIALPDRVYGPTLTLKTLAVAAEQGIPVYFYGSTEQTLNLLLQRLQPRFPGLIVAGADPSKFRKVSQEEKTAIVDRIRNSGAKIVFVGLGCPRQEVWVYEYRQPLSMPLLAVGAAFTFHAGVVSQAPEWMQNAGLEWFYRFCREPIRLWKRYLLLNPTYLVLVVLEVIGIFRFSRLVPTGTEREESYG